MASIIRADTWQNTQGVSFLSTTTSGHINFPQKPIISGQIGTAATHPAAAQKIPFGEFWVSRGITYESSTRRFYVPVDGIYRVTFNPFTQTGVGAVRVLVGVNNDAPAQTTHYGQCYGNDTPYETLCINSVVSLNANDYIVFYLRDGTLYNQSNDFFNQFTIEMIG